MENIETLAPVRGMFLPKPSPAQTAAVLMEDLAAHRLSRVQHVRSQIAAGTYESDEKLDLAIERLMVDL